jgi:hypothetical protein
MTPKEKANEIGNAMYNGSVFDYDKQGHLKEIENAKRCALIAVNELIKETGKKYWYDVKTEIEKL